GVSLRLTALGENGRAETLEHHEYYRLWTSTFLHGNIFHLVLNCCCLWMAGFIFEGYLGATWLLSTLFVSSFTGSAMSLLALGPDGTSVGASAAILGLLAASLVTSARIKTATTKQLVQLTAVSVLLPSLLPLHSSGSMRIDYAGHVGGAAGGV